MPGPYGARLQVALLSGVRACPLVLGMAGRRRSAADLPVRAADAQAAPVGITDTAVAAEMPEPPAVTRPPGPGVPRRALRDDAPGPGRGHGFCRRRLRRGGPDVHRR